MILPRQLPAGTRLTSLQFTYQYLERTATGYRRVVDNGRVEEFDASGKLSKVADGNNNWILLHYDTEHRLDKIEDNFGRVIQVDTNEQGLVQSVGNPHGGKIIYRYNRQSELVYSRDAGGMATAYQYDTLNRHNLVAIGYADGTTTVVSYYSRKQFENVWSVKDRDNTLATYRYDIPLNGEMAQSTSYKVSSVVRGPEDSVISTSSYQYFQKIRADGEQWTYRLITVVDGDKTDTFYEEGSGLPLAITRGGQTDTFKYDTRGHVILKNTQVSVVRLEYDDRFDKVSVVTTCHKHPSGGCTRSAFTYDDRGNLVHAISSNVGQASITKDVKLTYDGHGRISTMATPAQTVSFQYNSNSKPTSITVKGLGTLTVGYGQDGSVAAVNTVGEGVTPQSERIVALKITSLFQDLLDVIRPAGVSLSL